MIGRVEGRVVLRGADHVVIDANGIGWLVQVSDRTLRALPGEGEVARLWTELVVREDSMTLLGFETLAEKEWHRLLTGLQGVGAKASMAILGALGADGLARAVATGDWASVKAAPGVGPKIAQRVVHELKDKAPAAMAMAPRSSGPVLVETSDDPSRAEAMSALANLGYAPAEAARAVAEAEGAGAEGTAALIRAALKRLAPAG